MAITPITKNIAIPAKNAFICSSEVSVTLANTKALQGYIRAFQRFADDTTLKQMGIIARDTFNEYVPYRSGKLRKSCEVFIDEDTVSLRWGKGLDYAHYQYMGHIYNYNHVYFRNGIVAGWYSSEEKHDSGRIMVPNMRTTLFTRGARAYEMRNNKLTRVNSKNTARYICRLGYSHPNTGHHWIEEIVNTPTKYTPMKRQMTRYLYEQLQKNFSGKAIGT